MNQPDNYDCLDTEPSAGGMETAEKEIETQPSEISGFNDDDDQHKSEFGNEHRADAITTFVYQDFSNVPNDASCLDAIHSRVQPTSKKLPTKLNDMLSDPDIISIVAWLPHGRSWQILDRYRFTNEVLPKHFDHSNFDSFIRLVNAWGFRRVPSGVDRDSYYHELFLRGMPHLHKRMKRTNSKKAPMESRHQHPNFYKMPLPDDPNTNMATTNEVKAIASSSTIPPSPKRNDISAQGPGGIPQIQGTFNTASSLYHPHHTHSGLERNAIQLPVTSPHILMQGLQQSMSQSNSQQSARMFPPNIVWNPSSNMQFLLPSTAPALTAASSFAPAPIPLPITSFPTSLAPNLGFSPQLFQPQHPSQHWQHLHLPVHNMGAHALSQQPMQSQNVSSMTTSSQSQNLIEQCSNQTPPSHPTQTQFWTNLPSSLPTLQYQNPTAAPFPGGNSNNTQDSSAATTSFNLMAGRGQRPNHRNDGDANGL